MIYRREDVRQLGFACAYDEVAQEPLVLTIDEFVEQLDLRELHGRYSEGGTGYYDPGMLLKVWFFAYCDRSWRCREVAQRVCYDVRYRYFVGSHRPDFRTLNRFRHDHLDLLAGYFTALVSHCEQQGLIDSSVVAMDGTKLRANASGQKRGVNPSLRAEISRRLKHDDQTDEAEAVASGAGQPSPTVSATDVDARQMKTGEGTIRLCYNAQVVVDNHQIIVAAAVGTDADDKSSFVPLIEQARDNLQRELGAITADGGYYSGRNIKYARERGLDIYIPKGQAEHDVFSLEQFVYDRQADRYQCPNGQWLQPGGRRRINGVWKTTYRSRVRQCRSCPLKARCTRSRFRTLQVAETAADEQQLASRLASPSGQAIYDRRRVLVEPVFGNLKFNFGFTRFSLRGLRQVKGEFLFLCIAHNLKKLTSWRSSQRARAMAQALFRFIKTMRNRLGRNFSTLLFIQGKNQIARQVTLN